MKLCRDCKWLRRSSNGHSFDLCVAPGVGINPSSGEPNKEYTELQRSAGYSAFGLCGCGPWAFWFEPIEGFPPTESA